MLVNAPPVSVAEGAIESARKFAVADSASAPTRGQSRYSATPHQRGQYERGVYDTSLAQGRNLRPAEHYDGGSRAGGSVERRVHLVAGQRSNSLMVDGNSGQLADATATSRQTGPRLPDPSYAFPQPSIAIASSSNPLSSGQAPGSFAKGYSMTQERAYPAAAQPVGRPELAPNEPARSSSFGGADGQASFRHTMQAYRSSPSPGDSPTRSMQSVRPTTVDRNSKRDSNSGSGSGSYSSHSFEQNGQQSRPRISQAPHTGSRTASLYGFPSSASNSAGDSIPPPPAPLLDQSHLQVGDMASLLSHDKTLELYRLNAKKTNDPDIQYEFCVFVMDVVADLEYSTMLEKIAAGEPVDGSQPPSPVESEAKQKQQALVAESIALLNRLATRGHVNSCYFLADCYTQGIGTAKVGLRV